MRGRDPLGAAGTGDVASPATLRREIQRFLAEDVGRGDVTTRLTVPDGSTMTAAIVAREPCVVAGLGVAAAVFSELDSALRLHQIACDGTSVSRGFAVATIGGATAPILTGERLALNLLQRLSGIATITRRYVDEIAGTGASISDTRKTTPGLRAFEKYAVRVGGGRNHRSGLYDAILIKDNHIAAAGGIAAALRAVRNKVDSAVDSALDGAEERAPESAVQIEVDSLEQLSEALTFGVDAVLLDNMTPEMVATAVRTIRAHANGARCWIEASGGISLSNVRRYAESGVDTISIGALTHSAPSVDLALDVVPA